MNDEYEFVEKARHPDDFSPSIEYENGYYRVYVFYDEEIGKGPPSVSCEAKKDGLRITAISDTTFISDPELHMVKAEDTESMARQLWKAGCSARALQRLIKKLEGEGKNERGKDARQ